MSFVEPTAPTAGATDLATLQLYRRTCREKLLYCLDRLNDEEIRPLAYLAERLLLGKEVYGSFEKATDKRVMLEELRAELADGLFYLTAELETADIAEVTLVLQRKEAPDGQKQDS